MSSTHPTSFSHTQLADGLAKEVGITPEQAAKVLKALHVDRLAEKLTDIKADTSHINLKNLRLAILTPNRAGMMA